MFGKATITLGIGPHSSILMFFLEIADASAAEPLSSASTADATTICGG